MGPPRHASTLETLGLHTLGDLLYYYPRRYDDYSQLKPIKALWYGEQVTVIGAVQSVHSRPLQGGARTIVEAVLVDGTGSLRLTWFNQPWLANRLREGQQLSVSGKIEQHLGRLVMRQPDWEAIDVEHLHTNRIVPIYPLTGNITQKWLRGIINQVVTWWAPAVVDPLPEEVRSSAELLPLGAALLQAHFPDFAFQIEGCARASGLRRDLLSADGRPAPETGLEAGRGASFQRGGGSAGGADSLPCPLPRLPLRAGPLPRSVRTWIRVCP